MCSTNDQMRQTERMIWNERNEIYLCVCASCRKETFGVHRIVAFRLSARACACVCVRLNDDDLHLDYLYTYFNAISNMHC